MKKTLFAIVALCCTSFAQTTIFPKTTVFPKTTIFGAKASGAIAFVNAASTANGTFNCAPTLSVTSGNTIVAIMSTTTLGNTFSISDTDTNAYTTALAPFTNAGNTIQMQVWTGHIATTNASDVITMHVTSNTNFISCVVMQFSGIVSSSIVDQTATASFASTTAGVTGTTATTSQAKELLIGAFGALSQLTDPWTPLGGYTIDANAHVAGTGHATMGEYLIVNATGTYQATATANNTATTGAGIIITLKGL